MKALIDECLHTSLVEAAHAAGHAADHVTYVGLGGAKDWQLMSVILEQDYTFVTNNRSDFLSLYGKESLHAGLIVIVPNVVPSEQRRIFEAILQHIGQREIVNAVIEADYDGTQIRCSEYIWPTPKFFGQ